MYSVDYGIMGGLLAFLVVFWVICLVFAILQIIGMWKTFNKAGLNGWAALIPFYNVYTLCKMVWGNGWYFFLFMIPLGGIIFGIVTFVKVAKVFGKGGGFALGLVLLPSIFFMILGFDNSNYLHPDREGKGKIPAIVASAILGVCWVIILIVSTIAGITTFSNTNNVQYKSNYASNSTDKVVNLESCRIGPETLSSGVKLTTLTNSNISVDVPIWEGDYLYEYDSTAGSQKDNVTVSVNIGYSKLGEDYGSSLEDVLYGEVDTLERAFASSSEYISNVSKEEAQIESSWAVQKIDYTLSVAGNDYPCFDIIKVQDCNGYPVTISISVRTNLEDKSTQAALQEAYELYDIKLN